MIQGNAELLSEELAADPRRRALAGMITAAAQRGAELTRRLLAFARKQTLEPRKVDVNAMLADTRELLARSLGEQVEVDLKQQADLWPALVDPAQFESALMNLCLNARDAMPGGMNGRELANAARALRPGLRVLFTSGYTENAIVHHGTLDPGVDLLAKPYRRSESGAQDPPVAVKAGTVSHLSSRKASCAG